MLLKTFFCNFFKKGLRNGKMFVFLQRSSSPKGFLLHREKAEKSAFYLFPQTSLSLFSKE